MTDITKPPVVEALDALIGALRESRERAGDCELTSEEEDILAAQIAPIGRTVCEIAPEALDYMARDVARDLVKEREAHTQRELAAREWDRALDSL